MKRIATIAVVCLFVIAIITGCAGGGSSSSAAGKYVLKTVNGLSIEEGFGEIFGTSFTAEELLEILGIDSFEEFMVIELKADGTAVITTGGEDPSEATWKQDGNTVSITSEGQTVDCTLNGNELTLSLDNEVYVLVKK